VFKELKILIVDDDPVILEIARIVLESLGHHVLKRENPLGTTAEIVREQPDMVLVDVYMPFVSGDQLIRSIKEGAALKGAKEPVFVLYSGAPESELNRLVNETGADGAIHKKGDALDFASNFARLLRCLTLN
jgi:CheY-like chemotaxis protein